MSRRAPPHGKSEEQKKGISVAVRVGDEVELRAAGDELRPSTLKSRIARAQQRLRRFIKAGRSLSDEFIAERRDAAKHEEERS
jgi:hypothetical protein